METIEAIKSRRSIRKYKSDPIPEQTIRELLELAAWAPSGINSQPWAFVVLENKEYLKNLSDRAKAFLLEKLDAMPALEQYRNALANPNFNIFYDAPVLVIIYGDKNFFTYINDCSMAALNMMLAAYDKGLGSCWIGFASSIANTSEVKKELNVPERYEVVAPIILGYPDLSPGKGSRKELNIINWKK
ncbi:nitroreductase [Desulfofarcimen acetoxidans DSM 771]|jgi:nitroreductase|uniref:Nitroreductase n=1 Tax=Desulfofarcimen acetoxidans (strain ATCC 49208 / DSM 771 / KCTC 5769 / VKM B-1644 / 5575) TaxID=485916 RepID=C8W322_DESAS|nr:nitroreductase [Desulfofarcimen acetoxidans]ACV61789.1 nitroreductase [Desulfofarcimen acetoxidans DSM 771]